MTTNNSHQVHLKVNVYKSASYKFIVSLLVLISLIGLIPKPSWAATLSGVQFIDVSPTVTAPIHDINNDPNLYTQGGFIIFQPLNSPGLTPFSATINNGNYTIGLSDGDYEVWQFVDAGTQIISGLQWASQASSLKITVAGNVISYTSTSNIIPNNKLDFPVPVTSTANIDPTILNNITTQCDPVNRVIICQNPNNAPSGQSCDVVVGNSNWPNSSATQYQNDDISIYGTVNVMHFSPTTFIQVKSLCNYENLVSGNNNPWASQDITIEFEEYFVNFQNSTVIAADSTPNIFSNGNNLSGGSITLKSPNINISGISVAHGDLYNLGVIQAGKGKTFTLPGDADPLTFGQSQSVGGNIVINVGTHYQYGTLVAGEGSEITFNDFWDAWNWEHVAGNAVGASTGTNYNTPSSSGGHLTINAPNFQAGQSFTSAGKGGNISILNNDDCGNNPGTNQSSCVNEIEGSLGGNLNILSNNTNLSNSALQGNSVYVEPDGLSLNSGTTITADTDIVLYGGDDFELKINGLSANAIQAGNDIILAVGANGTIDLTGNTGQIFKVGNNGSLKIYSDTPVILDAGATLSELAGGAMIILEGSKIIYHVVTNGSTSYVGEAGNEQDVTVEIANASSNEDTFTLNIENSSSLSMTEVPETITVAGLNSH